MRQKIPIGRARSIKHHLSEKLHERCAVGRNAKVGAAYNICGVNTCFILAQPAAHDKPEIFLAIFCPLLVAGYGND
jgi:hypothetical protein